MCFHKCSFITCVHIGCERATNAPDSTEWALDRGVVCAAFIYLAVAQAWVLSPWTLTDSWISRWNSLLIGWCWAETRSTGQTIFLTQGCLWSLQQNSMIIIQRQLLSQTHHYVYFWSMRKKRVFAFLKLLPFYVTSLLCCTLVFFTIFPRLPVK